MEGSVLSYRSMLKHRVTIMRQTVDLASGSPVYGWTEVKTNVRCFMDLNFIRHGKDAVWTPESQRSTERQGVAFFMGDAPLKIGDWLKVTKGPQGVFSLEGGIDEAWKPERKHHLEVGVKEVPKQFEKGQLPSPDNPMTGPVPVPPITTTTTTTTTLQDP